MPSYVRAGIRKCARIRALSLDDIDCDFSSKDKLPTEDLKCVVYRGDKKTKVTLHASENKLGLYTQDGKRFPIK